MRMPTVPTLLAGAFLLVAWAGTSVAQAADNKWTLSVSQGEPGVTASDSGWKIYIKDLNTVEFAKPGGELQVIRPLAAGGGSQVDVNRYDFATGKAKLVGTPITLQQGDSTVLFAPYQVGGLPAAQAYLLDFVFGIADKDGNERSFRVTRGKASDPLMLTHYKYAINSPNPVPVKDSATPGGYKDPHVSLDLVNQKIMVGTPYYPVDATSRPRSGAVSGKN